MKRKGSSEIITKTELRQEGFNQRKVSVGKRIVTQVCYDKVRALKKLDQSAFTAKLEALGASKGRKRARRHPDNIGEGLSGRSDD